MVSNLPIARNLSAKTYADIAIGAHVNFDTCVDDGASHALFGTSGVGLAVGVATRVSCAEWKGSKNLHH
jgi:hypothetical protein